MEFYEVVSTRRTIRDFENVVMDDKCLERILEAGLKAPTNDHMRDWHFVVLEDKEAIRKLMKPIPKEVSDEEIRSVFEAWNLQDTCQQMVYQDAIPKQYRMFLEASCVIVPLFRQHTDLLKPENLSQLNSFASIWCCIENILLAATAEGLACTLRIPLGKEDEWAREVLHFPDEYQMPCFLAIGKPRSDAKYLKQKDYRLQERIHKNHW